MNCNDLMPRNAPKPVPILEVAAKPLVPEVSLLLDQDKNKSFNLNTYSVQSTESKSENYSQKQDKGEILPGNQFESYNTWRAKNAQALHTLTGSLSRVEIATKDTSTSKLTRATRKQSKSNDVYQSQRGEVLPLPINIGQVSNKMYSSQENKPDLEFHSNQNENCTNRLVGNFDQQHVNCQSKLQDNRPFTHIDNCPQSKDSEIYPHSRKAYPLSKGSQNPSLPSYGHGPQNQGQNSTFPSHVHHNAQEGHFQNVHPNTYGFHGISRQTNDNVFEHVVPNYFISDTNQGQCQCRKDQSRVSLTNGMGFACREPEFPKEARQNTLQTSNTKVVSPLNIAQINNQTVIDLYQIIHLQNEQILMLQQQVKQVLQIHLNCDGSLKKNCMCHSYSCEHKNNLVTSNDIGTCTNLCKLQQFNSTAESNSTQTKTSSSPSSDKHKRSVGVMTSVVEDNVDCHSKFHSNVNANTQTMSTNIPKPKKKKKKQPVESFPSHYHHKQPSQREERRKTQRVSTYAKKKNKEELKACSQVDNSFSLNEAEFVIRTVAEQDDISPSTSVHVDLQDYCSSSDSKESDTTASSSDEEAATGSATEEDSSDPQLGWTFYNRVVGQVNNILKKSPTSPRQGQAQIFRTPSKHLFNGNADYDTENNWSKRVTFDGPVLNDSDTNVPNIMNVPRYHQTRPNQEYKTNGGSDRMQDFMMYNIANGNTNLSFATLRCLEHYNLLPTQPGLKSPEHSLQGYQRINKQSKRKNKKSRNLEMYSHMPQTTQKRTSSKLLDITTLKQQPKLF